MFEGSANNIIAASFLGWHSREGCYFIYQSLSNVNCLQCLQDEDRDTDMCMH